MCLFAGTSWVQAAPVYECKEKGIFIYSDRPCEKVGKQSRVNVNPSNLGWKSLGQVDDRSYYVHFGRSIPEAGEVAVFYNLKSPGIISVGRGVVNGGQYLSAKEIVYLNCDGEELQRKRSTWYSERDMAGLLVAEVLESNRRGYAETAFSGSFTRYADFLLTTICKFRHVIDQPNGAADQESDCIGDEGEGC